MCGARAGATLCTTHPRIKVEAIEEAGMAWEEARVYLDGSGIGGKIGVVAILFRGGGGGVVAQEMPGVGGSAHSI